MKTITIINNGQPVAMFKVKASTKVAEMQAEVKMQSLAIRLGITNLTYSIK